mmetsp:Transcript_12940/g.20741  ORF Transcript_12940/g.20741 Transcript_12940/m.20741 type:complete len:720 (+) Transcript_12940:64-2223(+)
MASSRTSSSSQPRSLWSKLIFGNNRNCASRECSNTTREAVQHSSTPAIRQSPPMIDKQNEKRKSAPELPSPTYPAPTADGKQQEHGVEMQQTSLAAKPQSTQKMRRPTRRLEKSQSRRRMPLVRVARMGHLEQGKRHRERRDSRLASMVDYFKDLVVGRCLCQKNRADKVGRVIMLHADPLVSVDATQYAPGKEVPVDLEIPSLPSERHVIEDITSRCHSDIDVVFRHLSRMSLGEELSSTEDTSLLHISAHGTRVPPDNSNYAFVMENECGFADFCLMSRLSKLLQHCNIPRCVVLSACYSELAAHAFLASGARHVIACKKDQRIMDSSARYFNRFFYMALFNGHTVRRAFEIAKANVAAVVDADSPDTYEVSTTRNSDTERLESFTSVPEDGDEEEDDEQEGYAQCEGEQQQQQHLEGDIKGGASADMQESEKFVLLPEDGDHEEVLFPTPKYVPSSNKQARGQRRGGRRQRRRSFLARSISQQPHPLSTTPPVPSYALGRHVQVSKCVSMLRQHRCVNVIGRRRIGKSTIAKMCTRYVEERNFFADGVYYIDMKALAREASRLSGDFAGDEAQSQLVGAFVRAIGLHDEGLASSLKGASFRSLFQLLAQWHCLFVLDNANCALGASLATELLRVTHKAKVLMTSNMAIDLDDVHRQVVVVRELSLGSSRELIRALAPWKNEKAIASLIAKSRGCPGSICSELEAEMKQRGGRYSQK